ncbi:MAG TPA: hydantoinase/oxoprolinase family protein [Patescibacteria group bacterium]|nr:hydantoinase/oxoprolinase family protein [Patescibacteria group bacterium]
MFNVGVDIGGTFTDAVAVDDEGRFFVGKAPTVLEGVAEGVMASLQDLARNASVDLPGLLRDTRFFGHGTTVGTNALLTRNGARVGLLITAGMEHTPIIQRKLWRIAGLTEEQRRHQVTLRPAAPLVERDAIEGVIERVDFQGRVLMPLSAEEAERAVRALLSRKVEAIAICLMWSFLNPAHEQLLLETVQRLAPGLPVSVSSDLAPKMRENARCNSVLIDAFVSGKVRSYLSNLEKQLSGQGFGQSVGSMQCFGGVSDSQHASAISTIGSGPVGGVMASKYLAALVGEKNVITTDVGGTSFDVSAIWEGEEIIAREFFGSAGVMERFEVLTPRVDITSIGAGGGTVAWFDTASKSIKLGPDSAGSNPGPIFYGQGGTRVTVADAWLTLGYLDPERFLGGRLKVDAAAAKAAIETQLAQPLGMSLSEAALGVLELANHYMSDTIKIYLTARGLDISKFILFAFGGGGPMHAAAYGELSGVKKTYLVANASVFSALGIALADPKHKQQVTLLAREPFDLGAIAAAYHDLEKRVVEQFRSEGLPTGAVHMRHFMDLRYRGQFHEMTVEIPGLAWMEAEGMNGIRSVFERHYRAVYGAIPSAYSKIELVGLDVDGIVDTTKPSFRQTKPQDEIPKAKGYRSACFTARQGYQRVPVYAHGELLAGQEISGPAFVQSDYMTMIVLPGQTGQADEFGNLVIDHTRGRFFHG